MKHQTSHRIILSLSLLALLAATPGLALSQGRSQERERDRDQRQQQDQRRDQRNERDRDRDNRNDNRNDSRNDNRQQPQRWSDGRGGWDERGAGPGHNFHRGERLPVYYQSRQYVVEDWRGHRLSAPPRGYHWVQTGGDYVLVAIATGIILQLLLNN